VATPTSITTSVPTAESPNQPPVEINAGKVWDLTDSKFCDLRVINWPIIGYNAQDPDGDATLKVIGAWHGSQSYPIVAGQVQVGVAPRPFPETVYHFTFDVEDDHGVHVQGTLGYRIGPC
jgi:hypothetical protein